MVDNLDQKHFRIRTDSGAADDTPTWAADEDVPFYPGASNFRLRVGVENTGDATGAVPWALYVDNNGGGYNPVTTSSNYARSINAGSDADETAIMIQLLGLGWWLSGAQIDLDFQNGRYYDSTTTAVLTDYLSCSRASTGYAKNSDGTLTSFGTDTLRIGTGTGLLVEDARTNEVKAGNDIRSAAEGGVTNSWFTQSTTAVSSGTAPDGSTATTITATAGTGDHERYITVTTTAAIYTFSIYVKAGTANWVQLQMDGSQSNHCAFFNLSAGTVGTVGTNTTASIEAYGSGWYRCIVTSTTNLPTTSFATIMPATANGQAFGWSAAGTENILAWGVQLELGSFATSYVPTTGAAATRSTDEISVIGNLLTNVGLTVASVYIDVKQNQVSLDSGFLGRSADNARILGIKVGNDNIVDATNGSGAFEATLGGSQKFSTGAKVAVAWNSIAVASICGGGGTIGNSPDTGSYGQTIATVGLGRTGTGSPPHTNGYFRRLATWTSRLANATLQSLTT